MRWEGTRVLVTGGASFIGSHLAKRLVNLGAEVRVVDDLSSGLLENIRPLIDAGRVTFIEGNLLSTEVARMAVDGIHVVFHLAAAHGGRGFIDLHQIECSTNLILDGQVIHHAAEAGVENLVFASSGCVYPNSLQSDPKEEIYLEESMAGPPYDADNLYGWAKLMAELTLRAYCDAGLLRGASVRYFTAYGPRCLENHAVMAMIARAYAQQTPFVVWGTGRQIRNWTFVDDIVTGTIAAAEHIDDGRPVNLGTTERISVLEAARLILSETGHDAPIECDPSKPTGPYNRVCDNTRAKELLGWTPQVDFADGVRQSIEWYFEYRAGARIDADLPRLLTERST